MTIKRTSCCSFLSFLLSVVCCDEYIKIKKQSIVRGQESAQVNWIFFIDGITKRRWTFAAQLNWMAMTCYRVWFFLLWTHAKPKKKNMRALNMFLFSSKSTLNLIKLNDSMKSNVDWVIGDGIMNDRRFVLFSNESTFQKRKKNNNGRKKNTQPSTVYSKFTVQFAHTKLTRNSRKYSFQFTCSASSIFRQNCP